VKVSSVFRGTDEERHLSGEDELVALKEAACRVDEDRVRDAVNQVDHSLLHLLSWLGSVNRLLEHHAERLHAQHVAWPRRDINTTFNSFLRD